MPMVFYDSTERRMVINGVAFPAEPIQAKKVLEAFGLDFGEVLHLYDGSIIKDGEIIAINTAFMITPPKD